MSNHGGELATYTERLSDMVIGRCESAAELVGTEPPTADDVSITRDGRRLDSPDKVLAFLREINGERAAEATAEPFDPDRILATLDRHGVDLLLVGGFAARAYGARRRTVDIDCVPDTTEENWLSCCFRGTVSAGRSGQWPSRSRRQMAMRLSEELAMLARAESHAAS